MVSWSSAIWCTTSRADTLLQDNEFLSISILLYDIFAIFSIYKILKNSHCGAVHFFWFTRVYNFCAVLIIRFQEKLLQNLELSFHSQFLRNSPTPISHTTSTRAIFFQLVCIGSKKSPPISRVNKHQYNNNKRVRRESSLLEIAIGEGIISAQLGKSSLRRNRAWYIHPLEFRCAESRERLQEERQPGAPCCMSSDNVWRVAVNGYETTRS